MHFAVRLSVLGVVGLYATTPDNELFKELQVWGKVREL